MKNLIIGLVMGAIAAFFGMSLFQKEFHEPQSQPVSNLSKTEMAAKIDNSEIQNDQPLDIVDVRKKVITSVAVDDELESLSTDELRDLVRNYQTQVSGLTDTVKTQQQAITKLNDERERERNPLEEQNLSPEQANAALNNIKEAITTADPEYKEVLESALNLFDGEELATPTNDALLRHYSDEPNIQWAPSAQAWLQSYFQSGLEPDINLIQLNCRATYCELYGFYGSDATIADYRAPAAKISNFFRQMSDGPGYGNLFRNVENISLNTSSDNTFMSFHVFIRSVN